MDRKSESVALPGLPITAQKRMMKVPTNLNLFLLQFVVEIKIVN